MSARRRIVSFLPSATEMAFALGLDDQIFGVTHECDYPPAAASKAVVVSNILPIETMSQKDIDRAVSERLGAGLGLYRINKRLIQEIAPDLILTQKLCPVCAPADTEIIEALSVLAMVPEVLWLTPHSIGEIFENLWELARATGREAIAKTIIDDGRNRLERVKVEAAKARRRPRVFCMEWIDPIYCSGHWVPEMVSLAGGEDCLGRPGADSVRIPWDDVLAWAPEVLVVAPCGFNLERSLDLAAHLFSLPGWENLPAVRDHRVHVVDANAYFARPGPRIVRGTELLAHLFHPDLFPWEGPVNAFRQVSGGSPPSADSDDAATLFRTDAAGDSDLIPPVLGRSVGGFSLDVFELVGQA